MIKTIVLIAVLAINTTAMAINKCASPDGGFVFQDLPCVGKGEAIKVMPGSGHSDGTTADAVAKGKKMVVDTDWRGKVQGAIARGQPLVGMTRAELDQAMGAPTKVNAANYSGVLKDQIIYRQSSQTWYVYTDQGVVVSIQNSPEEHVASAPRAPCLSAHAIRDMETSASSITLGDAERAERWKQIGDAKKCVR